MFPTNWGKGRSNRLMTALSAACVAAVLLATSHPLPAQDAGELDAKQQRLGRLAFIRCRACHTLGEGEDSKVGPNLHDFYGNEAATRTSFGYSEALTESGIVWDEDTLARWLQNPADLVPGNTMAFAGIANPAELEALIAYLLIETR